MQDDFNFTGAYQTAFCLQMVCYDPVNHEEFNRYAVPGDGTTCGHQKVSNQMVEVPVNKIVILYIADTRIELGMAITIHNGKGHFACT